MEGEIEGECEGDVGGEILFECGECLCCIATNKIAVPTIASIVSIITIAMNAEFMFYYYVVVK